MKTVIAGMIVLTAGAVQAEGWGLMSPVPECAGLESLVVWGLIDGGAGGDPGQLSEVVAHGDPALCLEWLDFHGYPGLYNPVCVEAFAVLSGNGLPPWLAGQEPDYLARLLAPRAPDTCDNMLIDLTAGE